MPFKFKDEGKKGSFRLPLGPLRRELQSDYLMNSFRAEPLVTFGKWNNVTSRSIHPSLAECRQHISLLYV